MLQIGRIAAPTKGQCRTMLAELKTALGSDRAVAEVLSVPVRNVWAWLYLQTGPSRAAVKAIWLTWALILHPERCQTVLDLATWGRFRPVKTRPARRRSFRLLVEPEFLDGDGI